MRKGDVVALTWVDSISPIHAPWIDVEDLDNVLPKIISIGYVHALSRTAVTLVSSWSEEHDHQVGGVITIPRAAVVAEVKLELGRERNE